MSDIIKIKMDTSKEEAFKMLEKALLDRVRKDNPEENIKEDDDYIQSLLGVARAFFETGIEFGKKEACQAIIATTKNLGMH